MSIDLNEVAEQISNIEQAKARLEVREETIKKDRVALLKRLKDAGISEGQLDSKISELEGRIQKQMDKVKNNTVKGDVVTTLEDGPTADSEAFEEVI